MLNRFGTKYRVCTVNECLVCVETFGYVPKIDRATEANLKKTLAKPRGATTGDKKWPCLFKGMYFGTM